MYAYAASDAQEVAQDFLGKINEAILFPLITLMMALALLIFLYGAFEYVKGASNDSDRETGKRHLLWGTIGMLVMLSAMSILYVAAGTFELEGKLNEFQDSKNAPNNGFFDNSYLYEDQVPSSEDGGDHYSQGAYDLSDDDDGESGDTPVGEADPSQNKFATMDATMFSFYESRINEAYANGPITSEELVGFYYAANGEYPANYLLYENTELMPMCEAKGGSDVFSISVNNDTGRHFYCIDNN